jgi:hypothetical protein
MISTLLNGSPQRDRPAPEQRRHRFTATARIGSPQPSQSCTCTYRLAVSGEIPSSSPISTHRNPSARSRSASRTRSANGSSITPGVGNPATDSISRHPRR